MELQNIRISARWNSGNVNFRFLWGFTLLACMLLFLHQISFSAVHTLESRQSGRPPIDYSQLSDDAFEPGMFRVKFTTGTEKHQLTPVLRTHQGQLETGIQEFDRFCREFRVMDGYSVLERFYRSVPEKAIRPEIMERHREWGFDRWYTFSVEGNPHIPALLEELGRLESVEVAEPVFRIVMADIDDSEPVFVSAEKSGLPEGASNDPRLSDQWSFHNYGQNGGTPGVDIGLIQAWSFERGLPDVIVAVIDGGIYAEHPDLRANMWQNAQGHFGYNFANETQEIFPGNHATHVAGTVAAVTNNGIGVSGIAGGTGSGDGVRIMSCQVFGNNRTGGFHLAPVFAADNGAAISQNSWSYSAPGVYDQISLDAIDYFNTYGGGEVLKGGITIFAAGNRGKDEEIYPAFYSGTVAVASTNSLDVKALNSTFGDWVDISAPGVGIVSTIGAESYGSSSGTSMASPHVAGVAALLVSLAPGMLSAEEVIDIIKPTADDHYPMNSAFRGKLGTGRLNAGAALMELGSRLGITPDQPPSEYFFLADGDWDNPDNWSLDKHQKVTPASLPESNSHRHVMARANADDPILLDKQGSLTIYPHASLTAAGIVISVDASVDHPVTIHPLGRLTSGYIQDDAGGETVRILADASGSGSLIHESGEVQTGIVFQFGGQSGDSHMLAVPLAGQAISDAFGTGSVYGWHEPGQSWVAPDNPAEFPVWQEVNLGSMDFLPGKGYMATPLFHKEDDRVISFSGLLQSGAVNLQLSGKSAKDDDFGGLNLVGNPYASAIDWNAASGWEGRNHLKTADGAATGYSFWVWNPETGNYGAYNNFSRSDAGTNGASRYIQPMQAFWVRAESDGAHLVLGPSTRIHQHEQVSETEGTAATLRLSVSGDANSYRDEMVIEFGHAGDRGGTEKLFSIYPSAPALYSEKHDTPFSINFLDITSGHTRVPVGFRAGENAGYTIVANGMHWFEEDVYLVDRKTGETHNLSRNPSYSFTATSEDEPSRFLLQFGEETTTNTLFAEEEVQPRVFHSNGLLHIVNPWHEETRVQVFSSTGAALTGIESVPQGDYRTSLQVRPGVYIVRLMRQGKVYTEKIIVRSV